MQRIPYIYGGAGGLSIRRWSAAIITAAASLATLSAPGAAVTRTWDGGAAGADANWLTAANWTTNVAPNNGDNLTFAGGVAKLVTTNNFPNNTDFGIITINDDYTLRGNTVDITNTVQAIGVNGV